MPDASSSDALTAVPAASGAPERAAAASAASSFDLRTRVWMVLMHYIPPMHAALVIAPAALAAAGIIHWPWGLLSFAALYVLPPAAARLAVSIAPHAGGEHAAGSRAFLSWWFCAQWQVLFNRFPSLEELLRLVPTLYSAWLRCWGARIGRLVYWSPGIVLFDRQLIEVGDRAIIGAAVRIVPHWLKRDDSGRYTLFAAPVRIGKDAMVGGHSLLPAGSAIDPGAVTGAGRIYVPARSGRAGRERPDEKEAG